jgi:hypothetical protein
MSNRLFVAVSRRKHNDMVNGFLLIWLCHNYLFTTLA